MVIGLAEQPRRDAHSMSSGSEGKSRGDPRWIAYLGAIASIVTIVGFLFSFGVLRLPPVLGVQVGSQSTLTPTSTLQTGSTVPPGQVDPASRVLTAYNNFCAALRTNQLQTAFNLLTPGYQQNVGSPTGVPDAVGGTFGQYQEHAQDCRTFFPVSVDSNGQRAVELGQVTVTDSGFGQHTIGRNFEFILTGNAWLINNVYAQ
jgi:hypothetical protein